MSSSTERLRVRSGFVLLEAMVALAIIGLVAIALLQTTGSQLRSAAQAKSLLVERALAEDRIAALQLLDYDDLGDPPDSILAGRFPAPFEAYTWTARVDEMKDEYDLFGAEVVIDGNGESFPLRTLIHSPRPGTQFAGAQQGGAAGFGGVGGRGSFGGQGGRGGRGGADGRAGRGFGGGRGGRGGFDGRGARGGRGFDGGRGQAGGRGGVGQTAGTGRGRGG
jgi:type II secretory pathway pseudopilin PulG